MAFDKSAADALLRVAFGNEAMKFANSVIGGEEADHGHKKAGAGIADGFEADRGEIPLAGRRPPQ